MLDTLGGTGPHSSQSRHAPFNAISFHVFLMNFISFAGAVVKMSFLTALAICSSVEQLNGNDKVHAQ